MLRMNWLGTSEPSSHPGIGTANPPVRLTQKQSFHAAGYDGERIRKIFPCGVRRCQAKTGDVLVLDHRLNRSASGKYPASLA
jgi:hypothetical protein